MLMRLFLEFFSLSDRYERKARLLPGLMLAATPALTAGSVSQELTSWYNAASFTVGIEFLFAVLLGHYARSRGRVAEDHLWNSWDGPPTTRWLRPLDRTCSDSQKSKWRGAIKRITGISIPASIPDGANQETVDRQIGDATRQLRYALRNRPEATILAIHNEDYGFARNLYGVRWHWVVMCISCLVGCGVAFAIGLRPYMGLAVSLSFTLISLLIAKELPDYVRRCADRYAESLFALAILAAQATNGSTAQPIGTAAAKA
jgi:hypothetical protein